MGRIIRIGMKCSANCPLATSLNGYYLSKSTNLLFFLAKILLNFFASFLLCYLERHEAIKFHKEHNLNQSMRRNLIDNHETQFSSKMDGENENETDIWEIDAKRTHSLKSKYFWTEKANKPTNMTLHKYRWQATTWTSKIVDGICLDTSGRKEVLLFTFYHTPLNFR